MRIWTVTDLRRRTQAQRLLREFIRVLEQEDDVEAAVMANALDGLLEDFATGLYDDRIERVKNRLEMKDKESRKARDKGGGR